MIFKTFDSDIDNMSSRWGMFGKSFSDIGDTITTKWKQVTDYVAVTNDATISGMMSAWKGTSPVQFLSDDSVVNVLNDYNKALDKGAEATAKFFETGTGNDFMNGWLKQLKGAPATMDDYKAAVAKAELAQNGLTASMVASKVAALALNVAVSMGVSIAISALIKLVDNLVHANEKAIEKAEELRDKYNDFKETNASNVKTLNGLKDEFEKLSDGVSQYGDNISLTTEQYARYQEIVQQIVGMSPSLAEGYDTENGYIADKNGLLERAIELQKIEYRNELRKITNLDNLKTSMSGYIAEYKEALNGGYVTSEGNIIGTTIDTDFKNSLWQVFNTNNRDNYDGQSMARDIMESLGVKDIDKEIKKYINEYGYWQDSDFWNDYCDKIVSNLDVVTNSLTAEEVGLDDTVFDQNIEKLESYAEQYSDMKDSVKSANKSIQTDLGYIAEYADGYSDLSKEQQKFITDYLKGFDISDITSENSMGILEYDEDKMASVKSQIKKFVEELSHDDSTKQALTDLYAPPSDNNTIEEYKKRIDSALEVIRKYCEANGIEIPVGISDVEDSATGLESSYKQTIENAKEKYGEDLTPFFKENSINTQEEIDKWREIAQSCDTATEAKKKYLETDTSEETPISTPTFSDTVSSLKDLKDQLSDLDTIMASFVSGDDIDVSNFDNIINKFTELKEAGKDIDMSSVEDAINQIGNSSSIEEAQSSLDSLCQQYINASGILDNLTESNAGFVQSQLEQIGVSNAAEIVTNSLAAEQDYLAWAKDNSAASSANLADMTSVEMAALLADANVTDEAKASMYNYWVAKGNVLDLGAITTDGDISNLSGLCSALGIATKQCETFAKAKSLLAAAVQSNDLTAIAGYAGQIAGLQASITTQISATLGSKSNSNYSPKYGGGSATKSAQEKADKANNSNKDKGSGSSDEPQEQDYDWIETLLSRIQRQVTNLGKTVSATYKKWSTRNNALTQELSAVNSEIDVQYKAYQKYIDLANSVGLSEDYASLVRNGSLDVSTIADDDLNEQISQYKQYYEAALDCADTIQDLNDKVAELAKSKFDNISSEYESQLKQIEHSTNIYQSYIDQVEAEDKIPLRSYYEQLIKNENSNINKLKEEYFVLTKAMNEAIAAGKIEKYSEDWYSMQEAVDSVSESIQDANKSLVEYTKSMKELAKTRFDKIATSFDNPGDLIDHSQTYYNNFIDEAEAEGHLASKDYYKALINLENLNLSNLVKESDELNKSLNEALKSGDVEKYSDTWYDMVGKINDVDEAIQDANKSLIEYGNNMRQIEWDLFDKTEDYISKLQDESDFIIDLLSNNELYDENTGNDTKYATALKGLHAVNYNVYMAQADEYAKEIKKLNSEIAKDPSNSTLLERRQELLKAQQDAISGAEDEKQSIKDLVSNGYDKMLDALQKLIDKRKEVLDAEKSLYDYEKSISEKTENLANLRKQWSALQGDNSEEAKTKRQQLETSIKDVESDLQDTEYQQYISDQEKLFDNFYDQTETWLNERLDNLDGIINDVIESTNANAYDISQTISEATSDVGYTLSDEMSRIWDHDDIDSINRTTSGIGSVVSIYGDDFSNRLTTTNTTIDGIKTLVQSLVDDSAKRKAAEDAAEEAAKATQASAQQAKQTSTSTTPSTSTTTKTTTSTTSNKSSSSNSNNSNNSSSGWGSWFVHKTDSFPKSKLDISNSIVDRLKYRDIDSAFNKRKDYYYAMGGTGTYKGSASQNTWMISQMKAHGFKKGGTIGSAIKQTGEDGYILARTGEEVLSLEKLEMLKEALKYTSNISYPNVSSPTIPNFANASQSINSNLDVGGVNIVMNGVNDMQAFSKQMRTALADDVKTQKMIKSMLWNNGMDYKKFK